MWKFCLRFCVIFVSLSILGVAIPGCSGTASPHVGGNVIFPEDNIIDTGQKPQRKGRTDFNGDLEESGRKAEPQGVGVQDIINNIVSLLGGNSQKGNVNLHTANEGPHPPIAVSPQNRLPFHNRINNRGPPKQNELPFEAIPLEPANINKRPNSPFAPNGIPLPVQIVPQRPGLFPGPRPQGPVTIPLRPPVRVTPPPLPDLFAFGLPKNISEIPPPSESPIPEPPTTNSSEVEAPEDDYYNVDNDHDTADPDHHDIADPDNHDTADFNIDDHASDPASDSGAHDSDNGSFASHNDTHASAGGNPASGSNNHSNDSGIQISNNGTSSIDSDIDTHEEQPPSTVSDEKSNVDTSSEHTESGDMVINSVSNGFLPSNISQTSTNVKNNSVPVSVHIEDTSVQIDDASASDYNDEETHYEYDDEPVQVANSTSLVSVTALSTSVVQPSLDVISISSVTPVVGSSSSVFPGPPVVYEPVPSKPVLESVQTPTPPLRGRPGMVISDVEKPYRGQVGDDRPYRGGDQPYRGGSIGTSDDVPYQGGGFGSSEEERPYRGSVGSYGDDRPYRGGGVGTSGVEPSMFWINKNQMQGDIFELTVNAAQNFGGGGSGATQTFRIPAAGRPVVEPVDIEELRGEDGILTVARPGDEFVSIDGKRTYFNLFPDGEQMVGPTPFPSPPTMPSSLPYHVPNPPHDQMVQEVPLPPPTKEAPRPGTAVSVPRPLSPVVPPKPVTPPRPQAPVAKPVDRPRDEKPGIGTFEIEEPPVKTPVSFKQKPKPIKEDAPLRIDTCQEGDDSTCEVGETCRSDNFGASCICRNGWGRKNPRLSCVELVNLALTLRIDRLSGKQLTYSRELSDPLSSPYGELLRETKSAMDSLLTRSLLPLYIGSDITGFTDHRGRLAANVTVHFEASPITTSPSFRSELSRQLVNTIESFSNRLGSSQLFVEGTQSPVVSVQDIDECKSSDMNDCSSNATCKNNLGSFECSCKLGFIDKKDIDPRMVGRFCVPATCSSDYCNKRGECRMEGAKKVCLCRGTFGGAQCDIDTEVVGVAAGASVTAILIIIITLVGLCWWSKKWRRDQDSELGMPHYAAKVPGHMALALPYVPQYARPAMPAQPYYMPAFIHPPADYELSSMHSQDILSQLSTLRRPIAPTLSLPPQLEARRKPEEEDGLVGAVRMWYRRLSKRKHPGSSNMSAIGVPAYPNPYMEHPISRPKRTGSVISHGKNRRAPPPPTQPPPPLIEFTEDRASLSSGLYDSIDDKQSLHT